MLDIFPEHTLQKYDALTIEMERALNAIGAAARADEAAAFREGNVIDLDPEEVIRDAHAERDDPERTEDAG